MDKRYYMSEVYGIGWSVNDRHFPGIAVAFCHDEHKADLICDLLNESWDKLTSNKRSE